MTNEVTNTSAGGFMSPAPNSGRTGSMQELGKDDFLALLVAKLENQDPLSPMEDEDFIAQLAQFSSVEQLTNIADEMAESNEWDYLQMQSINNVMAAGLIGKQVEASYDSIYYDQETNPRITLTVDKYAEELTLKIRNSEGDIVATLEEENVQPGKHTFEWDGKDNFGNRVDAGAYTVEATARSGSSTFNPTLGMIGTVEAVTYRDGTAYFRVDGMEIPFGDVSSISGGENAESDGGDNGSAYRFVDFSGGN